MEEEKGKYLRLFIHLIVIMSGAPITITVTFKQSEGGEPESVVLYNTRTAEQVEEDKRRYDKERYIRNGILIFWHIVAWGLLMIFNDFYVSNIKRK